MEIESVILFFYAVNGALVGAIAHKLTTNVREKVKYIDAEAEKIAARVARNVAILWNAVLLFVLLYVLYQVHTHGGVDISIRIKNYHNEIPKEKAGEKTPASIPTR